MADNTAHLTMIHELNKMYVQLCLCQQIQKIMPQEGLNPQQLASLVKHLPLSYTTISYMTAHFKEQVFHVKKCYQLLILLNRYESKFVHKSQHAFVLILKSQKVGKGERKLHLNIHLNVVLYIDYQVARCIDAYFKSLPFLFLPLMFQGTTNC